MRANPAPSARRRRTSTATSGKSVSTPSSPSSSSRATSSRACPCDPAAALAAQVRRQVPVLVAQRPDQHVEAGREGPVDRLAGGPDAVLLVARQGEVLVQADRRGVGADPLQPPATYAVVAVEQPHQVHVELAPQALEHVGLEGHHRGRAQRGGQPAAAQHLHERLVQRQPECGEVRGVLELDVHADLTPRARRLVLAQVEQLLEGEHADLAVVPRAPGPLARPPLAGPQGLDLGEVEVVHEPAVLGRAVDDQAPAAVGELGAVGDVGGLRQVEVVAAHQDPVAGAQHVGLDGVGARAPGEAVGEGGVLGAVPAGTAVPDDEWSSSRLPAWGPQVTNR